MPCPAIAAMRGGAGYNFKGNGKPSDAPRPAAHSSPGRFRHMDAKGEER